MHRVGWIDAALDELAAIWVDTDPDSRPEITTATLEIDRQLGLNPHRAGESRPGGRRIAFEPPLGVVFRIDDEARAVLILHAWPMPRRRSP
jgi:hypothetical protein